MNDFHVHLCQGTLCQGKLSLDLIPVFMSRLQAQFPIDDSQEVEGFAWCNVLEAATVWTFHFNNAIHTN